MTDDFRLLLDLRTNNCNMYVQNITKSIYFLYDKYI